MSKKLATSSLVFQALEKFIETQNKKKNPMNTLKAWNTKLEATSFLTSKNLYNQCGKVLFYAIRT